MKLTVWGTLPGLNEIIAENRRNYHAGAKLKKEAQYTVEVCARKSKKDIETVACLQARVHALHMV